MDKISRGLPTRALTIRHPWASALLIPEPGRKDIENRTWSTSYRGWIAIHAARRVDASARLPMAVQLPEIQITGALIGVSLLEDVVSCHPSPWFTGPRGFVLTRPYRLSRPIPVKGRLGVWHLTRDQQRRLVDQLIHDGWSPSSAIRSHLAADNRYALIATRSASRASRRNVTFKAIGDLHSVARSGILTSIAAHYPDFLLWLDRKKDEIQRQHATATGAYTNEGEIIGVIIESYKNQERSKISTIYVKPHFRGVGIGSYLVASHLSRSIAAGRTVFYTTFDSSLDREMGGFMKRMGFLPTASHCDRYSTGAIERVYTCRLANDLV
jgi:ribosomal protein S18 acetylase RimI-like enzyme